jgi:PAS domain S-box-containing protein
MNPSRVLLNFARAAAFVVVALALFALGTWIAGAWHIATFGPGYVPMAPITAALFLLLGSAHAVGLLSPAKPCCRVARWISAGITAIVGLLVILYRDRGLPWDDWFVAPGSRPENLPIGRMSLLAAVLFEIGAASLMASYARRPAVNRLATLGAGIGLTIAALAGAGYAAGVTALYAPTAAPIALLTVVTFLAYNLSLLVARFAPAAECAQVFEIPPEGVVLRQRLMAATIGGAVLIISLGFVYIHSEHTEARYQIRGELDAVANLKAHEIQAWRAERLAEGAFLTKAPFVREDLAALVANPADPAARERVRGWLDLIKGGDRYARAMVCDGAGHPVLSIPELSGHVPQVTAHLQNFLGISQSILTDLHTSDYEPRVHLEMIVPIRASPAPAPDAPGEPLAYIAFYLMADQVLFPMIQSWPSPSRSAETMLVRRDGNDVLYLNELRHEKNSALRLRRSMDDAGLVGAIALHGNIGVQSGHDYRGVDVLSAVRRIPGTSWLLVAKVDLEELYAPVRQQAWQMAFVLALMLGVLATGTNVIWRKRQAEFLRHTVQVERERKLLSERLALVTRYANDVIVVFDDKGRLLEANDAAAVTYGYSREEMRELPPGFWLPPAERSTIPARIDAFLQPGGARFETIHQRRDGSTFPVEVSARSIPTEKGPLLLAIVRDISQRRDQEQQIDRLTRLYAALSHINQAIVHSRTRQELLQEICEVLVKEGRLRVVWIGWHNPATRMLDLVAKAGDDAGYLEGLVVSTADQPEGHGPIGTSVRENRTEVCNDFLDDPRTLPRRDRASRARVRSSIALPFHDADGHPIAAISAYASEAGFFGPAEIKLLEEAAEDLSFALANLEKDRLRREAEAALHASEARFRSLFETSLDALLFTDPQGIVVAGNPAACELFGWSEQEMPGLGRREIVDLSDERLGGILANRQRTGRAAGEIRLRRRDGSFFEAEISTATFQTPQGLRASIVIRDVTARKQAEARLHEHIDELRRWHGVTLGREARVMELKREINELLEKTGEPPRYPVTQLMEDRPLVPPGGNGPDAAA